MRVTPALVIAALGVSLVAVSVSASTASAALTPTPTPASAPAPLKIMPLGASMTYGYNSTDGNGYREVLRKHLVDDNGLAIDYVGSLKSGTMVDKDNEGHGGYRIDAIRDGVDTWLSAAKPDLVLLNVGTNDTIQNYQLPTAPDRLSDLVDRILLDDPGVTVMVSTIMPTPDTARNAKVQALNATIPAMVQAKAAAGKKVHFVDIYGALTLADIGSDQIHPTDAGYVKIANAWYAALKPVLGIGVLKGQESGRCVDVPGASRVNGTALALWDCHQGVNQTWTATASQQLMVYGTKCLDTSNQRAANGTAVQISDCNGGTSQQWSIKPDGTIVGVASGKCLDAYAHSTANGTKLELWTCNGGANQKFTRQ